MTTINHVRILYTTTRFRFRFENIKNKDFLFEEGFFDLNISSFDSVTETIAESKLMKLDDLPFRRYKMSICLPIP